MSAPLCIYYRLYDLKKSVQLIVTYPKLIRGNKENWKEEALDNPQLYGMSPDTYQLFLN